MSQRVEAVEQATGRPGLAIMNRDSVSGDRGGGTENRKPETGNWRRVAGSGKRMASEAGSWEAVHRVLHYPLFVIC